MFRKLVTLDEAKQKFYTHFSPKPVGVEMVNLNEAYNRVLAEDAISEVDVPPFSRSTVDGYAVIASDTFGAEEDKPVKLKVLGKCRVGEMPSLTVTSGKTVEIATGAPTPKGANAVVMFEYTSREGDFVLIYRSVSENQHVMAAGFDIKRGECVLKGGQVLSPSDIGILAAIGVEKVKVYKKPKIAVISTGTEIVEPGKPLAPGKIYDINAYTITASILENGGEPINLGVIVDGTSEIQRAISWGLEIADIVLTSGATSVGVEDVIPTILNKLGKPGVLVCGIATKPGKPTTIALVRGKPVFALPGHPTSALMVFHLIVRPVIRKMAGLKLEPEKTVEALTATKMFPARGRQSFMFVKLKKNKNGELKAYLIPPESGAITTLATADGFVEIPANVQFIDENKKVLVHLLRPLNMCISWGRKSN